jgi:hypothetical protein
MIIKNNDLKKMDKILFVRFIEILKEGKKVI